MKIASMSAMAIGIMAGVGAASVATVAPPSVMAPASVQASTCPNSVFFMSKHPYVLEVGCEGERV